jgi:nucleoside-diphosphate-sugar epimerase
MNNTVLISGGTGFIASYLAMKLLESNKELNNYRLAPVGSCERIY